ncbi:hypothetical protein R7P80_00725 [Vibrio sp. 2092]|uniref:hypothetical protein n=1 Tax=Vibrio TaxID=662 RepID=UPI0011924F4C|nr:MULTISPECIES: hypothetical protein [Vibrio]MCA2471298.1 hypothetical protein [Vibrio alginolyticus]MDW2151318.1 hypothetical protein [Vibrio sp. 2092]TVN08247.1 hypothetical protein FPV63_04195 [Vibrio cholerae]
MNTITSIKGELSYYSMNVDAGRFMELLTETEKFFDFSLYSNKHVSLTLEQCEKDYEFSIPKNILDKIKERLPDFADIASVEYIENKDGGQPVTKYDMVGVMLAMIKAYDNSFEFESSLPAPDQVSLNTLLNDKDPGDFLYD